MASIEALRVGPLQPLHAGNEIRLGRLQKQMVVVAHEHVTMDDPSCTLACLGQGVQKDRLILFLTKIAS